MQIKLKNDLKELVAAEVISEAVSQKISTYYETQTPQKPKSLFTIFGVLGALLIGLGIILILAHNWDDFSRTVKTIWAFVPLLIGQCFVGFSIIKNKGRTWKEASGTFLYLAIGATIALISQIYNIPGSMGSFLLSWTLLGALLLYLLGSKAILLLHLVFSTAYACTVGYFDDNQVPWWYLVQIIWFIPYYIHLLKTASKNNFTHVLNWLVPFSFIITLGAFLKSDDNILALAYMSLFGVFYALGNLPKFSVHKLRTIGLRVLGSLGLVFIVLIASFEGFWSPLSKITYALHDVSVVLILVSTATFIVGFQWFKKLPQRFNFVQYAYFIFALIFLTISEENTLPLILVNLLIFCLGLFTIKIGAQKNNYGILNYGLLIITILIICRFFDTNIDFIIRGLLFVGIGVGFFAANYYLYKKQQKNNISTSNTDQL